MIVLYVFFSDKEGYTQIELTYNDETPENGMKLGLDLVTLLF